MPLVYWHCFYLLLVVAVPQTARNAPGYSTCSITQKSCARLPLVT
jgi:hypothetical protein